MIRKKFMCVKCLRNFLKYFQSVVGWNYGCRACGSKWPMVHPDWLLHKNPMKWYYYYNQFQIKLKYKKTHLFKLLVGWNFSLVNRSRTTVFTNTFLSELTHSPSTPTVSVTKGQMQSENIKLKVLEINNS
jgi:hypothetical protein